MEQVVAQLEQQWRDIAAAGVPASWGGIPALDGMAGMEQILGRCRLGDDAALLAVVRLAQTGDQSASCLVVMAMLPGLVRLAGRYRTIDVGDYLGQAWLTISGWPEARTRHLVANLVMDTHKYLVRSWQCGPLTVPTDQVPDVTPPPDDDPGAGQIIRMARRLNLAPRQSIAVLQSVYAEGLSGREAAARHQISEEMVRYRCSSAVRKLRQHRHLLAAA